MAEENEKLTGYEGTGQEDPFQDVEEENLPGLGTPKEEPVGETGPAAKADEGGGVTGPTGPSETEIAKTQRELKEKLDKEGAELEDSLDTELGLKKEVEKKDTGKEKKKEDEQQPEEVDPFADIEKLSADLDKQDEIVEKTKDVNWQEIATDVFDPELKIEVKENSITSFKEAVKLAVESAKQQTVLDLSKYNEEQKEFITFLENGGTFKDFMDPLKSITDAIIADDEQKVKDYLMLVEGVKESEVQAKIDDLIEMDKFDKKVEDIDNQLYALREKKFKEIVARSNEIASKHSSNTAAQSAKEKADLLDAIKNMKSFMGIELNDNVRTFLNKEVEKGVFNQAINNPRTKVEGRLYALVGTKILQKLQADAKDASRSGYNTGILKEKEKLHHAQVERKAGGVEEQKKREPDTDPLGAFTQLDKDAIDTD